MSDDAASKFMSSVINLIFLADGASETEVFEPDEAQRLRDDTQKFRKSAAVVRFGVEGLLKQLPSEVDEGAISASELDEALEQLIISSYRIGAATWIHNANGRHLNKTGMSKARKSKAMSPLQLKRSRIKNTVLPPLLASGASRTKQLLELDKALKAENAGEISPAGADRWRKQVLAMMAVAKTSA